MREFQLPPTNLPWLKPSTIFYCLSGSHAYGLNTLTSDEDFRGICIPPKEYFLGLERFDQAEFKSPNDVTIFNIQKFMSLAADCNPNIIELLWMPDDCVIVEKSFFSYLKNHRQLFLSQRARHSFSGYAMSQLKRIKTHKKWLLNPPAEEPTREKFGLPNQTVIPADQRGAANLVLTQGNPTIDLSTNFLQILQKENAYEQARREWEQYQNWKSTRNVKRAATEALFGYDTKHAMHLVRLLRMCREIATDGNVQVRRTRDHEELRGIREGLWPYEKLIEWADEQDHAMTEVYAKSGLPKSADRATISNLCMEIVSDWFN